MTDKYEAIVERYLATDNGNQRLQRAINFQGTKQEWVARLTKQLIMHQQMLLLKKKTEEQ
jgi:hypothetical protein